MNHNWEKYFDTSSEYWEKLQKLYKENDHFPKIVVSKRNLHHKFLRSFSKLEGTEIDNDEDNLVSLTEGEHFLAHYYIWKCTKKGYKNRTALPVNLMFKKSFKYLTDETVEKIVRDWKNVEINKGKNNPMFGKHHINPSKCKSNGFKDKKHSKESKKKMSEKARSQKNNSGRFKKGHIVSEETKIKISKNNKSRTNEVKEKISESLKDFYKTPEGKKLLKNTHLKISEKQKGKRWYNNGIINIKSETCPAGFIPGMKKKEYLERVVLFEVQLNNL